MSTDTIDGDSYDYGADADPAPRAIHEIFAQLDQLAIDSERADQEVERCEEQLKQAKEKAKLINERLIPELMLQMRQDDLKTQSGYRVKLTRTIRASMPSADEHPDRFAAAIKWLQDTHNDGVIKNHVGVTLERGDDAKADELVIRLTRDGLDAKAKKWVEPQTLGKLVREMLEAGKPIVPAISVYDQQVAKVKRVK